MTISVFIVMFHASIFAEDTREQKSWQFLSGWGDRLFSIFGDAFVNQQEQRQFMLNELSKSNGELTNEEINQFLKNEAEIAAQEDEQAMNQLKKMYDPEYGIFSGIYKKNKKLEYKKNEQVAKLDDQIRTTLYELENLGPQKTRLKLKMVRWVPIGDSTIDKEMTDHYLKLVESLIDEIK